MEALPSASRGPGPIHLRVLGGADSIGASSTLLQLGPHRFLIDCGVRPGSAGGEALPDLDAIPVVFSS
jgi:predicted metal-dependent RNase